MRKKHPHSEIDREMNRALKHAKSPAEIMAIKAEARDKKRGIAPKTEEKNDWIDVQVSGIATVSSRANPFGPSPFPGLISPYFTISAPSRPALDMDKLNALKSVEPRKVIRRAPDLVEVITAWRAWGVTQVIGGWRLQALGQQHIWEPKKEIEATCGNSVGVYSASSLMGHFTLAGSHPAPDFNCQSGVWAFKDLDRLVSALGRYSNIRVLGKVSLWGRVIETENGYRAEKAYPAELWLMDSSLEELGLIYDVPVRMAE